MMEKKYRVNSQAVSIEMAPKWATIQAYYFNHWVQNIKKMYYTEQIMYPNYRKKKRTE